MSETSRPHVVCTKETEIGEIRAAVNEVHEVIVGVVRHGQNTPGMGESLRGLQRDLAYIKREMFGNGKPGLKQRVAELEDVLQIVPPASRRGRVDVRQAAANGASGGLGSLALLIAYFVGKWQGWWP